MFKLCETRTWALCFPSIKQGISTSQIPVITVPVTVQKALRKHRSQLLRKTKLESVKKSRSGNESIPIVMCKRQMFNFYKGQTYGKLQDVPITSQGWLNRKSVGDYFVIHGHSGNPSIQNDADDSEKKSFAEIGIASQFNQTLEETEIKYPTRIQCIAIPHILKKRNILFTSETGSGKTLAYLLPILQQILDYKMPNHNFNSPVALVVTPGRELAEQIGSVVEKLTINSSLKTKVLTGGLGTKKMATNPQPEHTDVVISSLGVLMKVLSYKVYNLENLRHVVIDEADSLLDDSFNEPLLCLLKKIPFKNNEPNSDGVQLCLVGATIPRGLDVALHSVIDVSSLYKVSTGHQHGLMPHVPQKFIRLKLSQKPAELLKLVKVDVAKNKPVMIFSKNSSTCDFVSMFLNENGVSCINLHGDMHAQLRVGRYTKFQEGSVDVISCTDLGSRGLDTLRVRHVINYDFPSFMSDYIHRAGRTGRVGSVGSGHITNFIAYPHEVNMAQKIEMSAKKMEPLPNVNANIKRKLESLHDFL